jgi:hypothetical protein
MKELSKKTRFGDIHNKFSCMMHNSTPFLLLQHLHLQSPDWTSWPSDWHSCLEFRRSCIHISARKPVVLIEVLCFSWALPVKFRESSFNWAKTDFFHILSDSFNTSSSVQMQWNEGRVTTIWSYGETSRLNLWETERHKPITHGIDN